MHVRSLLVGFVAGALVGLAAAWLLLGRPAPPAHREGEPSPAAAARDVGDRPPTEAPPVTRTTPPPERPPTSPTPKPAPEPERAAPATPAPAPAAHDAPPEPPPVAPTATDRPATTPEEAAEPEEPPDPDDEGAHPGEDYVWSVDREGIRGAVRASLPAVKECYHAWLQANPTLGGKVVVRFTIAGGPDAETAQVTQATVVESSMDHPLMESCVAAVLSTLAFEVPEDGVTTVTYPFKLAAQAPEPR